MVGRAQNPSVSLAGAGVTPHSVGRVKIALVHMRHAHTGGTERFLNHIAGYLAERGHEITVVCRSRVPAPPDRMTGVSRASAMPSSHAVGADRRHSRGRRKALATQGLCPGARGEALSETDS